MKNHYKLSLVIIFLFALLTNCYFVFASDGVDALKEYYVCLEKPNDVLKQTTAFQKCSYQYIEGVYTSDMGCLEKTAEYKAYLTAKEEAYVKCEEDYQKKLGAESGSQILDKNAQNLLDLEKNKEMMLKAIKMVNDKYKEIPVKILENAVKKYQDAGLLPEQADIPSEELITQRKSAFTEIENKLILSMSKSNNMRVLLVDGDVEMKIFGSEEWIALKQDDQIPNGATIFTGMSSNLLVVFGGVGVAKILSFTEVTFNQKGIQKALEEDAIATELKLRAGDIEVRVDKWTYSATMQVKTPQSVTSVRGTHFWVSSDENTTTITGVYEGIVEVTDFQSGKSTIITPLFDNTPQIAVSIGTPSKENSSMIWLVVVVIVLFVSIAAYFVFKK